MSYYARTFGAVCTAAALAVALLAMWGMLLPVGALAALYVAFSGSRHDPGRRVAATGWARAKTQAAGAFR
jgi:hypothetical protein